MPNCRGGGVELKGGWDSFLSFLKWVGHYKMIPRETWAHALKWGVANKMGVGGGGGGGGW